MMQSIQRAMYCCNLKLHSVKCIETIVGGTRDNAARLLGPLVSIELDFFLQYILKTARAGTQALNQVNAFIISVLSGFDPRWPSFNFTRYNPATRELFNDWLERNPNYIFEINEILKAEENSATAGLPSETTFLF